MSYLLYFSLAGVSIIGIWMTGFIIEKKKRHIQALYYTRAKNSLYLGDLGFILFYRISNRILRTCYWYLDMGEYKLHFPSRSMVVGKCTYHWRLISLRFKTTCKIPYFTRLGIIIRISTRSFNSLGNSLSLIWNSLYNHYNCNGNGLQREFFYSRYPDKIKALRIKKINLC